MNGKQGKVVETNGAQRRKPELLAPGGSLESIAAALHHGADAVYAGVGALNARVRAGNVELSSLRQVVSYIHQHRGRLYVPLNVPLRSETLADAMETLARLYLEGADGVIVRDLELLALGGRRLPGLALHVSTQAGVASVAAARRVLEAGAQRAILARELDKEAIARIRAEVPELELEVFLFGAMCFGFSGHCLMGEAVSGRSGNYGGCGQPCRLKYLDGNGRDVGRLFSMKDLDLIPAIPELERLGVASLKIEGRLKSPAYVGCVVHWARRALDQGGLSEAEYRQFNAEIRSQFSRPRGPGFFHGERRWSELVSPESSGHVGLVVETWKVVRDREGVRLALVPQVDIGLHDGLLVSVRKADGEVEEVPYSIPALWSGRDRGLPVARAGRSVEIPIPAGWQVELVAIHSSDAVAKAYGRVPEPLVAGEGTGTTQLVYDSVFLDERWLTLAGRVGRVKYQQRFEVETLPARGSGFDADKALGLFPGAQQLELKPGLFVNPSVLKRVRREFVAAMESHIEAEVRLLAGVLEAEWQTLGWREPELDRVLVRRGPAAISWVRGVPEGRVKSEGGTVFRVEGGEKVTQVVWEETPHPGSKSKPD